MSDRRPKDPMSLLRRPAPRRILDPIVNRRPDAVTQEQLPLVEVLPTPQMAAAMVNANNSYLRVYLLGECSVIVTKEFDSFHLSVAHPRRLPTWAEVSQARYRLLPGDRSYAMILPPVEQYINIHSHCFQLVEVVQPADGCGPHELAGKAVPA